MPPVIIEHEEYPSVVVIEYNSIYRNELQNFIHNIKEEMIEKIKQESRRYAKRQITWFKSYENAIWLDATNENNVGIILEEISEK